MASDTRTAVEELYGIGGEAGVELFTDQGVGDGVEVAQ